MTVTNTTMLPLSLLSPNTGQVPGLPKNPRFIRDGRFAALKITRNGTEWAPAPL